jgi:hypothetical protein
VSALRWLSVQEALHLTEARQAFAPTAALSGTLVVLGMMPVTRGDPCWFRRGGRSSDLRVRAFGGGSPLGQQLLELGDGLAPEAGLDHAAA